MNDFILHLHCKLSHVPNVIETAHLRRPGELYRKVHMRASALPLPHWSSCEATVEYFSDKDDERGQST